MVNVAEGNVQRQSGWLSPDDIARIKQAVRNEAYPPQGRAGVGTVLRRTT